MRHSERSQTVTLASPSWIRMIRKADGMNEDKDERACLHCLMDEDGEMCEECPEVRKEETNDTVRIE